MAEDDFERKLTAIFYADVAGYSRLTGQDEAGTHKALGESLDVITSSIGEHGGRVVHFAGDAILAEFNSVRASVNAAVAAQRQLREKNRGRAEDEKLQFRIGINLGEVIVDRDDIFGDGVNIAARLESLADPGGICISGNVRDQIIGRLPLDLHDMGEQTVKNIAQPVRAYKVLIDDEAREAAQASDKAKKTKPSMVRSPKALAGAAVVVIAVVAGALFGGGLLNISVDVDGAVEATADEPAFSEKPAIAVLPFTNLSGSGQEDYLSDGITEDVITNLARSPALFVISRNSTFAYKGKTPTVAEVSKALGARYVVDGSFRKAGDQVRVSAQLVDATNNLVLWSNRFDRSVERIFEVQDEIASRISGALAREVKGAEALRARARTTDNLEAYDLVLRARRILSRPGPSAVGVEAARLLERAIGLDPDYAQAHASLARALLRQARGVSRERHMQLVEDAFKRAEEALRLDPNDYYSHWTLGSVLARKRQPEESLKSIRTALELNPNAAELHLHMVQPLVRLGRNREANLAAKTAIRLNPYHHGPYKVGLAVSQMALGEFEAAADTLAKTVSQMKTALRPRLLLAVAYSMTGRDDKARELISEAIELKPDLNERSARRMLSLFGPDAVRPMLAALTRVGLPAFVN